MKILCTLLLLCCAPLLHAETVSVSITGVKSILLKNVQSNLSLHQSAEKKENITSEQFQWLIDRSAKETSESLEPFGYYNSQATAQTHQTPEGWAVTVHITPGPLTYVRSVSHHLAGPGAQDTELKNIFKDFKPAIGTPLLHEPYEKSKVSALSSIITFGYPFAQYLRHEIHVFPELQKSDILLDIHTGPLYHVGTVHFKDPPFDEHLLNRFIPFQKDARYNTSIIAELQRRLTAVRYIKQVNITPTFDTQNHTVPLDVSIEAEKPNHYFTAFGYGTDTGIRGRLGWERHYFNRYAHGLNSSLVASQRKQQVDVTYIVPGKNPSVDHYEAGFGIIRENVKEHRSQVQAWSLSSISELRHWQRTVSVRLHEETSRENTVSSYQKQSSFLPRVVFMKSKRDQLFNPESGYKIILGVQGVMNRLSDADNFIQTHLFAKKLISLRENTQLLARTELGVTFPRSIEELPLSLRYFAGGDNSIRGFGYKAATQKTFSKNKKGEITQIEGGRFLTVGSLELVQHIVGKVSGSTFVDVGGAYNTFNDAFVTSIGVGLRWVSPIGPFRIECAKPVSVYPGLSSHLRIHFSFGPEI